jgi:hypothetical protein
VKFYQTLNQAPKGPKHGKHRRTSPPAHRDSVDRTDHGSGGASSFTTVSWRAFNTWTPFDPVEEPKPPAIPHAGIRTGELIGHRLWWMVRDGGEDWLCSLVHRRLWKPNETINGNTNEYVGDLWARVGGGTYAFSSADSIPPEITSYEAYRRLAGDMVMFISCGWEPVRETETIVSGTIKMWGDVVEHQFGYRAEFAKIASLDAVHGSDDPELLSKLRAKYLAV